MPKFQVFHANAEDGDGLDTGWYWAQTWKAAYDLDLCGPFDTRADAVADAVAV